MVHSRTGLLIAAALSALALAACSQQDAPKEAAEPAPAPAPVPAPAEPAPAEPAPEAPVAPAAPVPAPAPATVAPAPKPVPTPAAAPIGDAANGAKIYRLCAACHSVQPDRNMVGPSLHGVIGRKAGSVAGFNYSPANTGSGITWTRAELDQFLENPRTEMPGTRMVFAGLKDPAQRADLIAYLATLN